LPTVVDPVGFGLGAGFASGRRRFTGGAGGRGRVAKATDSGRGGGGEGWEGVEVPVGETGFIGMNRAGGEAVDGTETATDPDFVDPAIASETTLDQATDGELGWRGVRQAGATHGLGDDGAAVNEESDLVGSEVGGDVMPLAVAEGDAGADLGGGSAGGIETEFAGTGVGIQFPVGGRGLGFGSGDDVEGGRIG